MAKIRKAIMAGVTAGVAAGLAAASSGGDLTHVVVAALGAAIVAGVATWKVRNAPAT